MNSTTTTPETEEPTRVRLILRNGPSFHANIRMISAFPAALMEYDGLLVFENDYAERIVVRASEIIGFIAEDGVAVERVDQLWLYKQEVAAS